MRRLVLPRVRRLGLTPPQHRRLCHEDTRKPVTESSPQNLWAMVRRRATPLERHLAATALSILQLGFVANIEATQKPSAAALAWVCPDVGTHAQLKFAQRALRAAVPAVAK